MQVQQAKEQEDEGKDETDHEGLDVRPCLGEQDPDVLEQERQRLEDLARSGEEWDSEAEELAFKKQSLNSDKGAASRLQDVLGAKSKIQASRWWRRRPAGASRWRPRWRCEHGHALAHVGIVNIWWHAGLQFAGNDVQV